MLKTRPRFKVISLVLILAVFLCACEVPDISEFTKQSAEMTRGIRTGIKDTESMIRSASERSDLYTDATRAKLKKDLKDYQAGMKPTVGALDALDAYLEALNALSQANKKSEENSKAAVNAVTGLVTAVSGLTFASAAVNVATGLLTLAEEFRTAKDFKKRVNLAAEIVEGSYVPKVDSGGNPIVDQKGKPILVKACSGKAEDEVTESSRRIQTIVTVALTRDPKLTDAQLKELKPLSPPELRDKLRTDGRINDSDYGKITNAESTIRKFGCGVIDLIKFNIKDLKRINDDISTSMHSNAREKNRTVLGFFDALVSTNRRTQNELETILNYKTLAVQIRELEANAGDPADIQEAKIALKNNIDSLFAVDGQLNVETLQKLDDCNGACGNMKAFMQFDLCDTCEGNFIQLIDGISKAQFDRSNGLVEKILEDRAAVLYEQNTKYLAEVDRITPSHSAVVTELRAIDDKQKQVNDLLDSSLSALDAWAKSHANLRVAVNTKKPLTVSQLTSKVREIWNIIEPNKK